MSAGGMLEGPDFRAAELSPSRRRRAMRRAVIGQCLGMPLWHCLVTGGLGTMYSLSLGAGDLSVGLVNGALYLGVGVLPFVSALAQRRERRSVILQFWAISGLAAVPLALMPELRAWLGRTWALAVMGLSCMLYAGLYGAGAGAWTSLFRDVVPERISRRFLGVLRMAWQLSSLGVFLGAGLFIGPRAGAERYQTVLGVLVVGHFARLLFVAKLPRMPMLRESPPGILERVKGLWRDARRRGPLVFCGLCSFLAMLSVPSMYLYLRCEMGFDDEVVLLTSAAGMFGAFVTFPLWGRLAERYGETLVYQAGMVMQVVVLGLWLLTRYSPPWNGPPQAPWGLFPLVVALFLCGRAGEMALSTALARHAYRLRPTKEPDAVYGALQPAVQWAAGAAGVVAGGVLMRALRTAGAPFGLSPYLVLFFFNALAFLVPLGLLRRQAPSA